MKDDTGQELESPSKWHHSLMYILISFAITYLFENICSNQDQYLMVYLVSWHYFK